MQNLLFLNKQKWLGYLQVLEYVAKLNDEDYFVVKAAVANFSKQNLTIITATSIKEDLEREVLIKVANSSTNVQILKVEFQSALIDEDVVDQIKPEENFNNYRDVQFLAELFSRQKVYLSESLQITTPTKKDDENLNFDENENANDITQIDITQKRNKVNKCEEINIFLEKLKKLLSQEKDKIVAQQISEYQITESSLDKMDSPVTITIRLRKRFLQEVNNLSFKLKGNYESPVYLNFEKAVIPNELANQEYSMKMGKRPILIKDLNFSYVLGEDLSKLGLDIPEDKEIILFLHSYFKFSKIQQMIQPVAIEMFYHSEDSILSRKIEFILNFFGKYLMKIEIDLVNCQYCYISSNMFGKNIFFKLLCPPLYSLSIITKRKYELFNLKNDWVRVDNIFGNAYFEKYKNDIERLIMINNTMISVNLGNIESNSKEDFLYTSLIMKLKEYQLLTEVDLTIKETERPKGIEQVLTQLKTATLPFELKYNILCTVGQNRITQIKFIAALQKKINEAITNGVGEKIIEAAFQSFIRFSTNLNGSIRISDLNNKNLMVFNRDLKRLQDEMLDGGDKIVNKTLAMIKRVSLTPSGYLFSVKLPEETSTIIRDNFDKLNYFIRLHFEDENMETIHGVQYVTDYFYKTRLTEGISIFDHQFKLLTWSASQLRGGSSWMFEFKKARMTRQMFIDQIGDFKTLSLEQVAKNAARLGQGFSSSRPIQFDSLIVEVNHADLFDEDGKLYTDGVGKISKNLIVKIRQEMKNQFISAIQIRYHGAKGVLLLNDKLPNNTIQLRKSMVKFNPSQVNDGKYQKEIALLDYNKFRGGYLNRQIIILLRTLGIQDEVFVELQNSYLAQIENLSAKDSSIYKHFSVDYSGELQGLPTVIESIRLMVNAGQNEVNNDYVKNVMGRLKRRGLMQLRTKCNILVEKAARVLGVADDYGLLNEDEVVCIVLPNQDKNAEYLEGNIIVTRNPCLHPGDIRKVKAISANEIMNRNNNVNPYAEYYNCVVFPCKGKSLPPQCGGGDLDGDIYFVAWDERLIPNEIENPMLYDEEKKTEQQQTQRVSQGHAQTEDCFKESKMVEFILQYLNYDVLGKIDNSHLAFADQSLDFAKDSKCLELAQLHSAAVDYVKHGFKVDIRSELICKQWPDFMEKENKLVTIASNSILGKLYRDVLTLIQEDEPNAKAGFHQKGLADIKSKFIYKFDFENNELVEVEVDKEILKGQVMAYMDENCTPTNLLSALKCLNHIFDSFDSLCKMYDIKNEYEIYTGYFVNFTKGEGTRLKRKLNIENVQKRVILAVIQIKQEIERILGQDESRLSKISIIHFLMSYSPDSFDEQRNSWAIKTFTQELFKVIDQSKELYYQMTRLKQKFYLWYRGCSWFFFTKEIMGFAEMAQVMQEQHFKEQVLDEQGLDDSLI